MEQFKRLLLLSLIGISISTKGQVHSGLLNIDKVEVILGATSTTFVGNDWNNYNKIKIGYSLGVGVGWSISKKSSINLRCLVERKGIKFSSEVYYYDDAMQQQKGTSSQITNLNYLSFPLTFQYQIGQTANKDFMIDGGPYFSYLYKAQAISKDSWRPKEVYNRINDFKNIDYGLALWIAYCFNLKNDFSIKPWCSATFGIPSIGKESGSTGFLNARNQSFAIGVTLIKFN